MMIYMYFLLYKGKKVKQPFIKLLTKTSFYYHLRRSIQLRLFYLDQYYLLLIPMGSFRKISPIQTLGHPPRNKRHQRLNRQTDLEF